MIPKNSVPSLAVGRTLLGLALIRFVLFFPAEAAAADAPIFHRLDGAALTAEQIDQLVSANMARGKVEGLAVALIADGKVAYARAYGWRDLASKKPLETDTVMYGASLTKLVFAYMVMQLVDEGVVELDAPISRYLKKPLPAYPKYADLASDARWEKLTPRILLDHTPGFQNFRFINPDGKLDFKFDPGTRYAYSGEGINLLQFVLEEGLGLDVGQEIRRRVFDRFGMSRTSMNWRADFAENNANGYDAEGKMSPHDQHKSVRAAGSMDTTIVDFAKFLAGFQRGEGLSAKAKAEMLRPQIAITSPHQFPTLLSGENPANAAIELSSGLGMILFKGPYGYAWYKGGHNEWTGNQAISVEGKHKMLLFLSNDVRAEAIYPTLCETLLGDAGVPWNWEFNPIPALPEVRK